MNRPEFRHRLRVYWEDTDAGGVVFYANHLKFFERARTEWLRAAGFSQEQLRVDRGLIFIVTETHVHYLKPAKLDDLLELSVLPVQAGRAAMKLAQGAWRVGSDRARGDLLSEGRIRIACVDAASFRPVRIPTDLIAALAAST